MDQDLSILIDFHFSLKCFTLTMLEFQILLFLTKKVITLSDRFYYHYYWTNGCEIINVMVNCINQFIIWFGQVMNCSGVF